MNQVKRLIGMIGRNPFNQQGAASGMMLYPSVEAHYLESYALEKGEVYVAALNLTLSF